jgi:hypothetical protein
MPNARFDEILEHLAMHEVLVERLEDDPLQRRRHLDDLLSRSCWGM